MKLYKTTITPTSSFKTPLRGDTLFGQLCWSISFLYGKEKLEELLSDYDIRPFLIVSDAFAKDHLLKPSVPSRFLNEDQSCKKENKKKIWLSCDDFFHGNFDKAKTSEEIKNRDKKYQVVRNSINYKTNTTDDENFSLFSDINIDISPKDIYFLLRDDCNLEFLESILGLVADGGFGKSSSIGKGRFIFSKLIDVSSYLGSSSTFMALSPFTPHEIECKNIFYDSFVRFGKAGGLRANTNPFKKPILLANTSAIIEYKDTKNIFYIGKSIGGKNNPISSYKDIVHQGYAIVLPVKGLNNE